MKKEKLIIYVILFGIIIYNCFFIVDFYKIDQCLDRGKVLNYQKCECLK